MVGNGYSAYCVNNKKQFKNDRRCLMSLKRSSKACRVCYDGSPVITLICTVRVYIMKFCFCCLQSIRRNRLTVRRSSSQWLRYRVEFIPDQKVHGLYLLLTRLELRLGYHEVLRLHHITQIRLSGLYHSSSQWRSVSVCVVLTHPCLCRITLDI